MLQQDPNKMLTVKNGQQKCISFHIFPHVPLCKNCFCEVVNGQPCQDVPWKLYWHTSKALAMGMDRQRSHTHPQLATGIQTPKKITGNHLGYTMVVTAWWEKLGCAPQVPMLFLSPHGAPRPGSIAGRFLRTALQHASGLRQCRRPG